MTTAQSDRRLEDPDLLTGRARFIADLTEADLGLSNSFAHAAFVRSPIAHGRIRSVSCEAARQAPGVIAVLTVDDLDVAPSQAWAPAVPALFTQPLLADRVVRFVGEPIALVLADDPGLAVDAAELVDIDLEPLTPVIDLDRALSNEILLFDAESRVGGDNGDDPTNVVDLIERRTHGPDANGGSDTEFFDGCDVVVEEHLDVPRQAAAPIEPRGLIAWWSKPAGGGDNPGDLHVWAGTQRPHGYRDQLAALLDISNGRIHVTCPHVGGGFGGKPSRGAEEHVLPVAARLAGRAVRWIESRSDNLIASTHGRAERFKIRLGGTSDGRLKAIDVDMIKEAGGYPTSCAFLPAAYTEDNLCGCYQFDQVAFSSVSVATNTAPISAFRGAGRAPYLAALEFAVDSFARRIDMDPVELRRRNLIPAEAMPWRTVVGSTYDEADYAADVAAAADALNYQRWRRRQAETDPAATLIGIGVACYNHKTGSAGGEKALVSITARGGARVITGSTDQGHGHRTAWTRIVSQAMGIPAEQVEVIEGSTDAIGSGQGAIGSRSVQTAGAAIHNACDDLIELGRSLAARQLEAAPGDIVFALSAAIGGGEQISRTQGRFHVIGTPSRFVDWADISREAEASAVDLTCGDLHEPAHTSYPSGCHMAVVEIDVATGGVKLVRYVGSDDVGVRLSPTSVDGQLHGGIAAGVGQALGEVMAYDDAGNPLTGSFGSYQLPTADELPMFELVGSEGRSSFHSQGYKGVGESGTIGATPAVLNAVNDALHQVGSGPIGLPCTAERVWQALTPNS